MQGTVDNLGHIDSSEDIDSLSRRFIKRKELSWQNGIMTRNLTVL